MRSSEPSSIGSWISQLNASTILRTRTTQTSAALITHSSHTKPRPELSFAACTFKSSASSAWCLHFQWIEGAKEILQFFKKLGIFIGYTACQNCTYFTIWQSNISPNIELRNKKSENLGHSKRYLAMCHPKRSHTHDVSLMVLHDTNDPTTWRDYSTLQVM